MKVKNKDIRNYLLLSSDEDFNTDELQNFLNNSFHHTIEGIYNSLYKMLKKYDYNKYKIEKIIEFLSSNIDDFNERELKVFVSLTKEFNNNVFRNIKGKQKIVVSDVLFDINQMFNYANNRLINYEKVVVDKRDLCLEYMIFEDKNLTQIKKYLFNHSDVLRNRDAKGDDLFSRILKKYVSFASSDRENVDYYKEVLLLFLTSKFKSDISNNKAKYISILNKFSDKEHVSEIIRKIKNSGYSSVTELRSDYNIDFNFTDSLLDEIKKFKSDDSNRCDFTYQDSFTIDNDDCRCRDDALYLERCSDGGFILYIHITDVSSFVPFNSKVSKEAIRREESLYLRDNLVPMYPEYISEDVCSLVVGEVRNAITMMILVDENFNIIEDKYKLVKSRIKVGHKLNHEEADRAIMAGDGHLSDMLRNLFMISIKRKNSDKSKETYRKYESLFSNNVSHESVKADKCMSANIVQETMVLLNYLTAKYFKKKGYPFIYRYVVFSDEDLVKEQFKTLLDVDINSLSKSDLCNLRENLIENKYVSDPEYHKGLNLEAYSHCSSPVRRAADTICQKLEHVFIFEDDGDADSSYDWEDVVEDSVSYLNKRKSENELFIQKYHSMSKKRGKTKNRKKW